MTPVITLQSLAELTVFEGRPCLSLYQPTHRHHPANQQDPIRFRHLLQALEASLRQQHADGAVRTLLAPFEALAADADFWSHTLDGLAVMGAADLFRVYRLQRPVAELAVVADSFHTKPLRRLLQTGERCQVPGLNRHRAQRFEGARDTLDEIDGNTERFFRAVDRAVLAQHSCHSSLPLMLATLPEHPHLFRQASYNPFLMAEGLMVDPEALEAGPHPRPSRAGRRLPPRMTWRRPPPPPDPDRRSP